MDPKQLLRLNQGLLAETALLGLGSIVTGGLAGSAAGLAVPVVAGFSNFFAGMTGNNLGTLIERFRNSSDVLRNEDLAKAAGRTVAKALIEKISPNYSDQESLDQLGDKIEEYWVEQAKTLNLFETLQEDRLYQIFSQPPEQFTEYQVLPEPEWREVVTWLFQQGCERGVLGDNLENYQDVIGDLAAELATNFNKHLRQVLKDDANNGGQAFVGMLFDLHGATLAQIAEIRDYLPEIATRDDICRLLQQLDTDIRDELVEIRQTLQQYFDLTKPRLPIPQNCETIIADKVQDFVGRRYVFEKIRDCLQDNPKGYFILEADPGVGKSAILAKLVNISAGHCLAHFNSRGSGIVSAAQFLENICTQLIQGYKLNYDRLPPNTNQDGNVFAELLAEASKTLLLGQKLVIVVDALDEVDLSQQSKGSNVLYLPDNLPDNVYFILSKRPKQLPLPLNDYCTTFDLMQYPAESARDAYRYVEKRWQESLQIQEWVSTRNSTPEQFFTELVVKSENNFMYLRYVLNDIREGLYRNETIDSLPMGLRKYYQKHWLIMGMNDDPLPVEKIRIIYVLSEAREPVSRRLLAKFTGMAEYTLPPVLKLWEQFLRLQNTQGETRYSVYHTSFRDFLNEQAKDAGVDLEDINRRMGDNLADGAPL
ncbi:ATP-binding protein [Oxynema aestuarii]|uniref:ATP-binding protein n=1 Tax=Oxynema aestuarii AP17 TaxID=2064643 RepID=A0A6H1U1C4_9CYAN|nr:ATP-binding protein [Oxynema aestuarii]QIZ72455.1 ATP-binding protein [Oxynema aestuarii AP17]